MTTRTGAYSRDTDLTGLWSGEYWYAGMSFPTPFTAHLIDQQGDLSGTTLEPRTFGVGEQPELSAIHVARRISDCTDAFTPHARAFLAEALPD